MRSPALKSEVQAVPTLTISSSWSRQMKCREALRVSARDDTALFETPTDGYTDLSANIVWRVLDSDGAALDLSLAGRNLANVEQRNAVSFVKDSVVMPGRDIRLIVRLTF